MAGGGSHPAQFTGGTGRWTFGVSSRWRWTASARFRFPAAPSPPADPFPSGRSIFSLIDEGDRLCHHPFDAFDATVVRLLTEAATDPDVTAIKMTIYRAGASSPIVAALIAAAESGKDVV